MSPEDSSVEESEYMKGWKAGRRSGFFPFALIGAASIAFPLFILAFLSQALPCSPQRLKESKLAEIVASKEKSYPLIKRLITDEGGMLLIEEGQRWIKVEKGPEYDIYLRIVNTDVYHETEGDEGTLYVESPDGRMWTRDNSLGIYKGFDPDEK